MRQELRQALPLFLYLCCLNDRAKLKKVEMYGIKIPISTYRTQGAITFKVLSLKHTYDTITGYYINTKHQVSYNDGDCITDTIYEKNILKVRTNTVCFLIQIRRQR